MEGNGRKWREVAGSAATCYTVPVLHPRIVYCLLTPLYLHLRNLVERVLCCATVVY